MDKIYTAICSAARKGHSSLYIYDKRNIVSQMEQLQNHFSGYEFLYSVKANPFAPVLDTIFTEGGFGADAASAMEVQYGVMRGLKKENILYSAPGKTKEDIEKTITQSILIADSLHELSVIEQVAAQKDLVVEVGIRINPNFTMDSDTGVSGKFGIDEEILLQSGEYFKQLPHIHPVGIHIHVRSQILNADTLARYYQNVCALATRVAAVFGCLKFINFGGGIGVAYSKKMDTPLNLEQLGKEAFLLKEQMEAKFPGIRMILETGRFAVCQCGYYAAKIVDIKMSRGTKYYILNNTLNGFLRPSIAELVVSYDKDGAPNEPLYTTKDAFVFSIPNGKEEEETVTLCGNLCTGADVMAKNVSLPKAEIGDMVVVSNAGSYAKTLTPIHFASQTPPVEFLLDEKNRLIS